MRTDYTLDNRASPCPNASLLAGGKGSAKRGDMITFRHEGMPGFSGMARVLGRLTTTGGDDKGTRYVLALCLSEDATSAYIRWLLPPVITRVIDSPINLAAFFFAPTLPYDAETTLRLSEYGTLSEMYVSMAPERVAAWKAESTS